MANDPYSELGVARGAGADEIRKAFRKLAKELHPDKNPGDKKAEERFKRVSAAFDILGDPEKKQKFDRGEIDADGRETMRGFGGGGGGPFGGGGFQQGSPFGGSGGRQGGFSASFEGANFEDILGEMFGGGRAGGRAGGGPFGGGGRGGRHPRQAGDRSRGSDSGRAQADRFLRRPHARRHHSQGRL